MDKVIVARMKRDWIEPYSRLGQFIPVIVTSTHSRFSRGDRFDWGFVQTALSEGYEVTIMPAEAK